MILMLTLGFLSGIAMVISRGLYAGPLIDILNTMAFCMVGALILYVAFQIFIGIGSFFLKLLFLIVFLSAIGFGGKGIWNKINPNNQIELPSFSQLFSAPENKGT